MSGRRRGAGQSRAILLLFIIVAVHFILFRWFWCALDWCQIRCSEIKLRDHLDRCYLLIDWERSTSWSYYGYKWKSNAFTSAVEIRHKKCAKKLSKCPFFHSQFSSNLIIPPPLPLKPGLNLIILEDDIHLERFFFLFWWNKSFEEIKWVLHYQ